MIHSVHLDHVRFCAEECERQYTSPISVYHMMNAYWYALCQADIHRYPNEQDVKFLGRMVDPIKNRGYRQVPVYFRDLSFGVSPEFIEDQMQKLFDPVSIAVISADVLYKNFEQVHPFIDGNGRVAAILYNWHKRTLPMPVRPPELNAIADR